MVLVYQQHYAISSMPYTLLYMGNNHICGFIDDCKCFTHKLLIGGANSLYNGLQPWMFNVNRWILYNCKSSLPQKLYRISHQGCKHESFPAVFKNNYYPHRWSIMHTSQWGGRWMGRGTITIATSCDAQIIWHIQ